MCFRSEMGPKLPMRNSLKHILVLEFSKSDEIFEMGTIFASGHNEHHSEQISCGALRKLSHCCQ